MNRSERMKLFWQQVRAGERQPPRRGERSQVLRRKVRCNHNWLRQSEVVLTIYPHGELGFREPGRRAEYRLGLPEAFRQAVINTTNRISAKVKELRKTHTL